jgi:ribokinase
VTAHGAQPAIAVIGHVEWVTHVVGSLPARGAIADLRAPIEEPAGVGGVAAAAAARAGARTLLFTALGDNAEASRAAEVLGARGVEIHAAKRRAPQTPVLSVCESDFERTIMVVGPRLEPRGDDPLPWHLLAEMDAVYYASGDPEVLRHARACRMLAVAARRPMSVMASGVRADVIIASGNDPDEDVSGLAPQLTPRVLVLTEGAAGGVIREHGRPDRRYPAEPPPGPVVDTYGCGDSFAAGLTVGLGRGLDIDGAANLGATAGARCATWRGGIGPTPTS